MDKVFKSLLASQDSSTGPLWSIGDWNSEDLRDDVGVISNRQGRNRTGISSNIPNMWIQILMQCGGGNLWWISNKESSNFGWSLTWFSSLNLYWTLDWMDCFAGVCSLFVLGNQFGCVRCALHLGQRNFHFSNWNNHLVNSTDTTMVICNMLHWQNHSVIHSNHVSWVCFR